MSQYPRVFRLRQRFPRPRVTDVPAAVEVGSRALHLSRTRRDPDTAWPSRRAVAALPTWRSILQAAVAHFQRLGAEPFIVPAMGSHGGGTAEGQRRILESYGITPEHCGCPIRSSMDTVMVCRAAEGFPVHFDRHASEADHVLVCGRIKPHTRFVGDIESGLMKMMLIGLGKHAGALVYHQAIQDFSFGQILRSVAREVLTRCHILAGLAIVENAYDETACIAGVAPDEFERREPELLRQAREWLPRLPFDRADVLLIDEIGKDVSGAGLDTNVVGTQVCGTCLARRRIPKIKYIAVRGLTPETHRNATGIGLVEFCRSQVLREMDVHATRDQLSDRQSRHGRHGPTRL